MLVQKGNHGYHVSYCYYGNRDALLCTILDGVRASGNRDVCVKMSTTKRGYRLGPFSVAVEEEVESQYLRYLTTQPQGVLFSEAVERFNANIAYSGLNHAVSSEGLFAENKEKLITTTLSALLQREGVVWSYSILLTLYVCINV